MRVQPPCVLLKATRSGPKVRDVKEVLDAHQDVPEQLASGLVDAIRRGIQLEETQ